MWAPPALPYQLVLWSFMKCGLQSTCTVLLIKWLLLVTLFMVHICTYMFYICHTEGCGIYFIYVHYGWHICFSTCVAVSYEVEITVHCVLPHLCTSVQCLCTCRLGKCDLYFQPFSHICSVVYASNSNYSLSSVCTVLQVTFLMLMTYMAHISTYNFHICISKKWHICEM